MIENKDPFETGGGKVLYYRCISILSSIILWWYWIWVRRNKKIYADIDRTLGGYPPEKWSSMFLKFCYAMNFHHEFLANFYLRVGPIRNLGYLVFPFYRRDPTVQVSMKEVYVGEGLVLGHGFSIMCIAQSVGRNVSIFQQVTIGFTRKGAPIIEDDVTILAGAKVIGPVTIGRGAVIGANAVVTKDIPPYAIAVGAPARVIRIRKPNEFVM